MRLLSRFARDVGSTLAIGQQRGQAPPVPPANPALLPLPPPPASEVAAADAVAFR
jgi:hypothetical protein